MRSDDLKAVSRSAVEGNTSESGGVVGFSRTLLVRLAVLGREVELTRILFFGVLFFGRRDRAALFCELAPVEVDAEVDAMLFLSTGKGSMSTSVLLSLLLWTRLGGGLLLLERSEPKR